MLQVFIDLLPIINYNLVSFYKIVKKEEVMTGGAGAIGGFKNNEEVNNGNSSKGEVEKNKTEKKVDEVFNGEFKASVNKANLLTGKEIVKRVIKYTVLVVIFPVGLAYLAWKICMYLAGKIIFSSSAFSEFRIQPKNVKAAEERLRAVGLELDQLTKIDKDKVTEDQKKRMKSLVKEEAELKDYTSKVKWLNANPLTFNTLRTYYQEELNEIQLNIDIMRSKKEFKELGTFQKNKQPFPSSYDDFRKDYRNLIERKKSIEEKLNISSKEELDEVIKAFSEVKLNTCDGCSLSGGIVWKNKYDAKNYSIWEKNYENWVKELQDLKTTPEKHYGEFATLFSERLKKEDLCYKEILKIVKNFISKEMKEADKSIELPPLPTFVNASFG
jgi:hypothetical protein